MCERCKSLFFCRPHYCPEQERAMAALQRPELVGKPVKAVFQPEIRVFEAEQLPLEPVGAD